MPSIQHVRSTTLPGPIASFLHLPSPLLSLLAILPISTAAQSTAATTGWAIRPSADTLISPSTNEHTRSMATSFLPSAAANTTAASTTPTSPPISSDILPGSSHTETTNEGAFRYYWLILAIFGVAVALFLWWINRRRIKRKERMRLSGRNALARDMEGWINTSRWYHGVRRPIETSSFVWREEGLNERGEAPPPYQQKHDVSVAQNPAPRLSIPLRSLSREQVDAGRPPEYREVISRD